MSAIAMMSTGLITALMGTTGMKEALDGKEFRLYAGIKPAHANDSLGSATLLCTIKAGSAGVTFDDTSVPGKLLKPAGESWTGTNAASGLASFYRLVDSGDTGGASTTAVRLQGTVGVTEEGINMSTVNKTQGAPSSIDHYSVSFLAAS